MDRAAIPSLIRSIKLTFDETDAGIGVMMVSDISATVASSRHSGSIAIHEELDRWDELELQVFDLTSRSAA